MSEMVDLLKAEAIVPLNAQKPNEKKLREIMQSNDYIAEIKYDGYRTLYLAGINPRMMSRAAGVDGKQKNKIENVLHIKKALTSFGGYVFDGEIVHPRKGATSHDVTRILQTKDPLEALAKQEKGGFLKYVIFDCLQTPYGPIYHQPLKWRKRELEKVRQKLQERGIFDAVVAPMYVDKSALIEMTVSSGAEGIMLKNLNMQYPLGTVGKDNRPANHWYKIKHEIEPEDCFIIGYVPATQYYKDEFGREDTSRETRYFQLGWIGGIEIGQLLPDGTVVSVGSFSGISDELRQEISNHKSTYLKKVVLIKGFKRNESGVFTSPVFIGFREDKHWTECAYTGPDKNN